MTETDVFCGSESPNEYGDSSPARIIRDRAENVVRAVLQDEVGFARSVKAMVGHTIKEYRGRFLHELIQNGYDAHLRGTTGGKVAISFDETEGAHGTLYVANGGRPLTRRNFERMATLGESDKAIGDGIGNKGVGFKSVFQICDVPEIYSALDYSDPRFNGFSFRLGTRSDLVELLEGDEAQADLVADNLSYSMLTLPLFDVPDRAQQLRDEGYVTVVRLPVSSARAADEVCDRLARLQESVAPVMLFLDRLSTMTIQSNSQGNAEILSRHEQSDGRHGKHVSINDKTHFRVFTHSVPPDRLLQALNESVEEGALDKKWLEWEAPAEVSVAVGDGWEIETPHAFTYLPMGNNATAPFTGHINAPFVTDFARVGLDIEQPVNRMLFESVAELCLKSAEQLVSANLDANAVVDLTAWTPSSRRFIDSACNRLYGQILTEVIRVPRHASGWAPLGSVHRWPDASGSVITLDEICKVNGADFIDPKQVSPSRMDRLAKLGVDLMPQQDMLGRWVEGLASNLAIAKASTSIWSSFYDDLPRYFSSGAPLAGRKILLAGNGKLVPCAQKTDIGNDGGRHRIDRAVFFSPKTLGTDDDDAVEGDVDFSPPKSLNRRLIFLHADLDWYSGSQRTPGRAFLQDHGLAKQFRTAGLLQHLGHVMSGPTTAREKQDALEFAFRLFSSNPTKHSKELMSVRLEVPTASGVWTKADRAVFSAGWGVDGADHFSTLAALPAESFPELSQLEDVLLAKPERIDFTGKRLDRWREFLRAIGVDVALPIMGRPDRRSIDGDRLTRQWIARPSKDVQIPPEVVAQWAESIGDVGSQVSPKTPFRTSDDTYWFMGQAEISSAPGRARFAYAQLLARTLPKLRAVHHQSTWRRYNNSNIWFMIPTPLSAFLAHGAWIPVTGPDSAEREFLSASEVWFIYPEDHMAVTYSPVMDTSIRAILREMPRFATERVRMGLRVWGDSSDSCLLIDHLSQLLDSGEVPDTSIQHFRSTLASSWAQIGNPKFEFKPDFTHGIAADQSGQLILLPINASDPGPLFVAGLNDKATTTRLIRELAWPVIDVETDEILVLNEIASVLEGVWSGEVQVASGLKLDVLADGSPWDQSGDQTRLVDEIPWLPLLLACTMRYPKNPSLRAGKQIPKTLDELSRIRLSFCRSISFSTPTGRQSLPSRLRGVLPVSGATPTLLTESRGLPPTWAELEILAEGALELLGQSKYSAELSLNIRKLVRESILTSESPSLDDVSDALGVPLQSVLETEALVIGSVTGIVLRLSQVAAFLWDEKTASTIRTDNPTLFTMDGVHSAVVTAYSGDDAATERLLRFARESATSNELRQKLGIGLREFNQNLIEHFPGSPVTDHSVRFELEFSHRTRTRRQELVNMARHARLESFQNFLVQDDWHSIRDLVFLTPSPDWGLTIDELTEDLADQRINALMSETLGDAICSVSLPDWEQIREMNGKPLQEKLCATSKTIKAWCDLNHAVPDLVWVEGGVDTNVREHLDLVGALDFEELNDAKLTHWLHKLNLWPQGMPLSLELQQLGLKAEDLTGQESAAAAERQEGFRRQRQISLGGRTIELDETMSELVAGVDKLLVGNPKSLQTSFTRSALEDTTETKEGKGARSGTSFGGGTAGRMSDIQRNAVGLAGEMIAFHWLKNHDRGPVDDLCWVSSNRNFVLGGSRGDDGLGYDFIVPRKDKPVMYEVKATQGEAGMIELGETEVRCAQEHARGDLWRLLIVEEALSDSPRIYRLPNPFSPDSRSKFRLVGNSVRLRFKLDR
ncbi:DUF3883 domain-containing protein [Arthrobacter sp. GMC3]|uniref:DUF3883 domain-containing protein n=1 Tax=Arthrobacter sp. GMC3 TaxID=2058894 RepID=UPI000CE32487|nr:DUF3883 domain-containing protein [Arthrobacter sp. GMC3]